MNICVTGASRGLGKAICAALAGRGHAVWSTVRAADDAPDGLRASIVDVRDHENIERWLREMETAEFVPDALILNASVQYDDLLSGYDHGVGHEMIDVNLEGPLRCIHAFLPGMLARKRGSIVAIASTAALRPSARSAACCASKAGLTMALRSLRMAHGKSGVRFGTVCLGPVATEMWEGKKSILVPPPEHAAQAIARFTEHGGAVLWYPRLSTTLLRCSLWLPDRAFAAMSSAMLK